MKILVTTDWLADQIGADDLIILDASAHLPAAGRNPLAEFEKAHIPSAHFLGLPGLKNTESPVPAALPTQAQFADRMGALGVTEDHRIVLYDDSPLRSSARAFFMFRMFGFAHIALLDGGFSKWVAEGRPLGSGASGPACSAFACSQDDRSRVRSKGEMLANCRSRAEQVVDARDAARFTGASEDQVHGLAGGHIPGARHLHFIQLLNDDGTFKAASDLRAIFTATGLDLSRPIAATCGSGMTASVILFALELLGHRETALYDGSWSEWGADPTTPKETGPAQ